MYYFQIFLYISGGIQSSNMQTAGRRVRPRDLRRDARALRDRRAGAAMLGGLRAAHKGGQARVPEELPFERHF